VYAYPQSQQTHRPDSRRDIRDIAAVPIAAARLERRSNPEDREWVWEIKWDGYRLLVWIDDGKVRLVTRSGHDWTNRMPRLAARFVDLGVERALIGCGRLAQAPDRPAKSSSPAFATMS
jgi:ATP-dependent DNA ligase